MNIRTDIHAHYCENCKGYSPCVGKFTQFCLLTDSCVKCDRVLEGVEPVAVDVSNTTFYRF